MFASTVNIETIFNLSLSKISNHINISMNFKVLYSIKVKNPNTLQKHYVRYDRVTFSNFGIKGDYMVARNGIVHLAR